SAPAPPPSPRSCAAGAPDRAEGAGAWDPGPVDAPGRAGDRDRAEAAGEWATGRVVVVRDPGPGAAAWPARARVAGVRDPGGGAGAWGPGPVEAPGRAGARDRAEAAGVWATVRVVVVRDPVPGTAACPALVRVAAVRDPVAVAGEWARGRGRVVGAPATAAGR